MGLRQCRGRTGPPSSCSSGHPGGRRAEPFVFHAGDWNKIGAAANAFASSVTLWNVAPRRVLMAPPFCPRRGFPAGQSTSANSTSASWPKSKWPKSSRPVCLVLSALCSVCGCWFLLVWVLGFTFGARSSYNDTLNLDHRFAISSFALFLISVFTFFFDRHAEV